MPSFLVIIFVLFGVLAVTMNIRWYQKYRKADPETQARMKSQMRRWQQRNMLNQQNMLNDQMMQQNIINQQRMDSPG